jgi:hypothetical protein
MKQKVFVIGLETLPEIRRKALTEALERENLEMSEIGQALAGIYVAGSDQGRVLRGQLKSRGVGWVVMSRADDQGHGWSMLSLSGVAVRVEDAAQWVWSLINEPEKWHTV